MRGNISWCYTVIKAHQISAPPDNHEGLKYFLMSMKASSFDRSHFATLPMRGSQRVASMRDPLLTLNAKWGVFQVISWCRVSRDETFFEYSVWPIFQWEAAGFAAASYYTAHRMCGHLYPPKPGRRLSSQMMIYYGVSLYLLSRSLLENWYITDTNDHPVA